MTTQSQRFRGRPVEVDAVRLLLGVTTKNDIFGVCPEANVGVLVTDARQVDGESTDIRWCEIPTAWGSVPANAGDWIVRAPDGYRVLKHAEMMAWFEPAWTGR